MYNTNWAKAARDLTGFCVDSRKQRDTRKQRHQNTSAPHLCPRHSAVKDSTASVAHRDFAPTTVTAHSPGHRATVLSLALSTPLRFLRAEVLSLSFPPRRSREVICFLTCSQPRGSRQGELNDGDVAM